MCKQFIGKYSLMVCTEDRRSWNGDERQVRLQLYSTLHNHKYLNKYDKILTDDFNF